MTNFKHVIGAFTIFSVLAPPLAAADLTNTKALYASASYEEALLELEKVDAAHWDEQVDEYRALCFVALGRMEEAEKALEHLVRSKPLYSLTNDRLSPRVVSLFETVRQRTLPALVKELYSKSRNDYSTGNLDDAVKGFRELTAILSDVGLIEQSPSLSDIQELSEGFLRLAEAKLAALRSPAPVPPAPRDLPTPAIVEARIPAEAPTPAVDEATRIFSSDDRDVVPPVEIERRMPRWTPPRSPSGDQMLRGVLEVVSDTTGSIEYARVVEPLTPVYDRELVAAAKQWRFHPATKDGISVKYRWYMQIVLNPR